MIEYIKEEFDNIVYSLDFGFEEPDKLNLEWIDFLESVDWNKNYVVLERAVEGYFPKNSFVRLHKEIRKHKYPANKIIFLTSDLKIEKNYNNWNSNEFMYSMIADDIDGGILTFTATHPKWSFAKLDDSGFVERVAEKDPISDVATVGLYFWTRGSDYVKYAKQMIEKDIRTNNEFYVCPVYNEAIADGKKIKTYHIDRKQMWGLGTPEDLDTFTKEKRNGA